MNLPASTPSAAAAAAAAMPNQAKGNMSVRVLKQPTCCGNTTARRPLQPLELLKHLSDIVVSLVVSGPPLRCAAEASA